MNQFTVKSCSGLCSRGVRSRATPAARGPRQNGLGLERALCSHEERVPLSGEGGSDSCEMSKTVRIRTSGKWSCNISYFINTS